MKDSRKGECLWSEWSGEGYRTYDSSIIVFYTEDHVDIEHEVVKRALASAIQRDGVVHSLGDAFKKIENAKTSYGYAGTVDSSHEKYACNEDGETQLGDIVDSIHEVVWVEIT